MKWLLVICSIASVVVSSQNQCEGDWGCEHRWKSIPKMVRFRNAVVGTDWINYYSTENVVSFSRGSVGFFAMVKNGTLSQIFQTGMSPGTYEDLISCKSATVREDGTTLVTIDDASEPVFAICSGCSCQDAPVVTDKAGPTLKSASVAVPAAAAGSERTVVFIFKQTIEGQDLFIRGGIDASQRPGCTGSATTDPCAIEMSTNSLGNTTFYDKYNAWRVGDDHLDWYGAEPNQGLYGTEVAEGSPLSWTSSDPANPGYQELNVYGDHYWMIDTNVSCIETQNGWFEVKGYLTNDTTNWEADITQDSTCSGTAGGTTPYTTANHIVKCGFINVFTFGAGDCRIESF